MTAHAELGASGAKRWMTCPGQPALSRGLPNNSSIHARTGTVAHALAESCLLTGKQRVTADYLGTCPDPENPDIAVDQDMIDAVNVYLAHCYSVGSMYGTRKFWIERKVNLSALAPQGERDHVAHSMFGTADFMAQNPWARTLFVSDYKHGSGVEVQAWDNPQLWYYGLGALVALDPEERKLIERVKVTVVQPRDDGLTPVRSQTVDQETLMDWGRNELIPAAELADSLHGQPRDYLYDNGFLVPGDHCKFCPAAGICPAVRAQRLEKAKMSFKKEDGRIRPEKEVRDLSMEELQQVLDSADDIISWVKSAQQLAHQMLEQRTVAETDLGYKLVRKRPQRKWAKDPDEVADSLCDEFGLGDDEMFKKELRTPAQVEKTIGPAKAKKSETFQGLVVSQSPGTTLAPESDPREAVKPLSAKEAFSGGDDDEEDDEGLI